MAALSHRWGADRTPTGTTVWFEVDRPARETPLPIAPSAVADAATGFDDNGTGTTAE